MHRDIKPANVLVKTDDNFVTTFKLCDFECSKQIEDMNLQSCTFIGTVNYMAPEIISKSAKKVICLQKVCEFQ